MKGHGNDALARLEGRLGETRRGLTIVVDDDVELSSYEGKADVAICEKALG